MVYKRTRPWSAGPLRRITRQIPPGCWSWCTRELEWTYLNPEDPDPQPQVCHGRDQIAWALDHQAGRSAATEVEEIISHGDLVMVVARTPGADERRAWHNGDRNILVLTVAGGQISAMRAFRDRDQACHFAGLDNRLASSGTIRARLHARPAT